MFDHTSRYYDLDTAEYITPDGRHLAYKRRRFVPPGKTFALLQEVTVVEGDRLDRSGAFGDPRRSSRTCSSGAGWW